MVGMKPRDKEEVKPTAEKSKTFGTVSTITTEAIQDDDQVKHGATANHGATGNHETTTSRVGRFDGEVRSSRQKTEVQ